MMTATLRIATALVSLTAAGSVLAAPPCTADTARMKRLDDRATVTTPLQAPELSQKAVSDLKALRHAGVTVPTDPPQLGNTAAELPNLSRMPQARPGRDIAGSCF